MTNAIEVILENVEQQHSVGPIMEGKAFLGNTVKVQNDAKIFRPQESVITLLKEDKKFKFIYHFSVALLICTMVESALNDYFEYQRIYFMTRTLEKAFNKFPLALLIWIVMQLVVILFYYAFQLWSCVRKVIIDNHFILLLWDYASLIILIVFQLVFLISGQSAVFIIEFNIGTGFALALENIRFCMKMHAFARTNSPIILRSEKTNYNFRKYMYYLFAPTLLYKNSYPRTQNIRWRFVLVSILEFFGTLFFLCYYYERYLRPTYHNLGEVKVPTIYLLKSYYFTAISCVIVHFSLFYITFQAWFNIFAELLLFADRQFYSEWWEVDNFSSFFRKWNHIVQDWLYEFIYKELKGKCSKHAIRYIITFISAIFHEILFVSVLRFFYPVIFVLFFVGSNLFRSILPCIPKCIRGIAFWIFYSLGIALWLYLYLVEYRARANCTFDDSSWTSFFIPVSWNCIF